MCTKKESPGLPDEVLRDYLAQDLALAKLRLNESQRNMGRLFCLIILLVLLFLGCVGGFSATVFFITKEHTRQIEALVTSGTEISTTAEREHVYQEGVSGSAVLNNNISGSTITTNQQ